jgi:hypothetical protein
MTGASKQNFAKHQYMRPLSRLRERDRERGISCSEDSYLGEPLSLAFSRNREIGSNSQDLNSLDTICLDATAPRRLDCRPMRFTSYFYGYFWISHRTGGGETSA